MKHYINKVKVLTLLCVISLSMASCGDFLLIEPKTFVTEDNFWNEKNDVDQMVAGVYTDLQSSAIIERCIVWGELRSDNIAEGQNVKNNENLYRTLMENLRASNSYTDWAAFYKVINDANVVIERAPSVADADPTYTPSMVKATIAEMKGLRSLCMFYLIRAFKDVPFPTHAFQSEDDMEPMPAVSGDSIVPILIQDLEECVGDALRKYPKDENREHNSNCNRITQSAIYALLCDLCLWNGDYEKVVKYAEKVYEQKFFDYNEDYKKSTSQESGGVPVIFRWQSDAGNDVWGHGANNEIGYPLYPCYSGNQYGSHFSDIFGEGNSFESIFELAFTPTPSSSPWLENSGVGLYGSYDGSSRRDGQLAVSEEVATDAASISGTSGGKVFGHKYDIRAYINFEGDGDGGSKGMPAKFTCTSVTVDVLSGGNLPYKGTYDCNSDVKDRNWIFYRLTDVMLMQAEALVELGAENREYEDEDGNIVVDENLTRAFSLVWAVNRRSIITPNFATTNSTTAAYPLKIEKYSSKDKMRDLVEEERRRELMFEGKRWFDLLRRCHHEGTTDFIKKKVPSKGGEATLFLNYESLYWPYNKTELKSNTALKQKPYYGGADDDENNISSSRK